MSQLVSHVLRGGSWLSLGRRALRSSDVVSVTLENVSDIQGFRCFLGARVTPVTREILAPLRGGSWKTNRLLFLLCEDFKDTVPFLAKLPNPSTGFRTRLQPRRAR
jgi:hypothetical protein